MAAKKVQKVGKSIKGIQRYRDVESGKYYQEESLRPPMQVKLVAIYLYMNGLSFRRVAEILGVVHSSVIRWFNKYSCLFDHTTTIDKKTVYQDVEVDELFTYLEKKTKRCTFGSQSTENQSGL